MNTFKVHTNKGVTVTDGVTEIPGIDSVCNRCLKAGPDVTVGYPKWNRSQPYHSDCIEVVS